MRLLSGIDVSNYQGQIDWPRVAKAGISFAWIKATEGATFTDKRFAENWRGAADAGVEHGAYHYLSPRSAPEAQATHFLRTCGPICPALPPVLDVEIAATGESARVTVDRALAWLRAVEAATAIRPIVYTYRAFALARFAGPEAAELAAYPLWLAQYAVAAPKVPPPWGAWTLWQHTGAGKVDGIGVPVDRNHWQRA